MTTRFTFLWIILLGAIEFTDILTTAVGRAHGAIESMPIPIGMRIAVSINKGPEAAEIPIEPTEKLELCNEIVQRGLNLTSRSLLDRAREKKVTGINNSKTTRDILYWLVRRVHQAANLRVLPTDAEFAETIDKAITQLMKS